MHNHNNSNDNGHKGMMWMMIICCLVPFALLFLLGSKVSLGGNLWPVFIGVFLVAHIWMMFRGHGGHGDTDIEEENDNTLAQPSSKSDEHKHSGGCH